MRITILLIGLFVSCSVTNDGTKVPNEPTENNTDEIKNGPNDENPFLRYIPKDPKKQRYKTY